jgi:branched-chain amino acid transport system permease protein
MESSSVSPVAAFDAAADAPQATAKPSVSHLVAFAVLIAVVAAAPLVIYPVIAMKIMCYALFACAFNLIFGYVGLLPFGHAAFFGIGCYVTAWTAKELGLDSTLAILVGGAAGTALGAAFGFIAIRGKGLTFSMITLALAQMTYFFCLQAPFTGGEDGIQQVPRGSFLGLVSLQSDTATYWYISGLFLLFFLFYYRILHSPFGQVLRGIREHEPRTVSLGYPTAKYKYLAFVLSACIAGLAGGMKTLVFGVVTLADVHNETSSLVLLIGLAGGVGTIFGPLVGAVAIVLMEHVFGQFPSWITVINGLVFMGCVLAFRRGIVGELNRIFKLSL